MQVLPLPPKSPSCAIRGPGGPIFLTAFEPPCSWGFGTQGKVGMKHRSLIGGSIGDLNFEAGDLIDVPDGKVDEWLAAGLIETAPQRRLRPVPEVVEVSASDGASCGDKAG